MTVQIIHHAQYMYNVTLWRAHVTVVAVAKPTSVVCVLEINVTVNNVTISNVPQKIFYSEFPLPTTKKY
jgi:hypothetical protein